MNPGQQRFHDFLMSMVVPGNEAAAEAVLAQSFSVQDAGQLSPDAIDQVVAQLTPLVRPEAVHALQQVAERMKEMAAHERGDHGPGDHRRGPGDHHRDGQRHDVGMGVDGRRDVIEGERPSAGQAA